MPPASWPVRAVSAVELPHLTLAAAGGVPGRDLRARPEPEAVADALDVRLDGAFGDGQLGGDLPGGQTLGDQPRDLPLTLRQRCCRAGPDRRKPEEAPDARGQGGGVAHVGQVVAAVEYLEARAG